MSQPCNDWERLCARLQEFAYQHRSGCAQIDVTLTLVDGKLLGWSTPEVRTLEPYSRREELGQALTLEQKPLTE